MMFRKFLVVLITLTTTSLAVGEIIVPGADGSDGIFNPVANTQVDLSLASTGTWNGANTSPTLGVYDPDKWAVVFRYASVNIPSNVTVTFKNHPSRAPVVWLVSGSVTINGTLSLDGAAGIALGLSEPGPGGFRSGRPRANSADIGSGGFGPGGGTITVTANDANAGAGSYGSIGSGLSGPTYGNPRIIPLIGGSGGSRRYMAWPTITCIAGAAYFQPGAGGGAILLACQGSIEIAGTVRAIGGGGASGCSIQGPGGSGGALRIVSDSISGSGSLRATGGASGGGTGRIRIETNGNSMTDLGNPIASQDFVGSTAQLWAEPLSPSVRIMSIGSLAAPSDPRANPNFPADMQLSNSEMTSIVVEATNMPLEWAVRVRTVPLSGVDFHTDAIFVSGDESLSTWEAQVQFGNGFAVVQARAVAPTP